MHKLRGEEYGPETVDQAEREIIESDDDAVDLTPAQQEQQTIDRANKVKKELANRTKIMETYRLELSSIPDASLLIYTDGGWTKPRIGQEEECGWGTRCGFDIETPRGSKWTQGYNYQAKQITEDWAKGWQLKIHRCGGLVCTDSPDTATFVSANNTAEVTAAI